MQDCVTIGVGNNRPWRSAQHGGNDRGLIRIRGKLFEFPIDGYDQPGTIMACFRRYNWVMRYMDRVDSFGCL